MKEFKVIVASNGGDQPDQKVKVFGGLMRKDDQNLYSDSVVKVNWVSVCQEFLNEFREDGAFS